MLRSAIILSLALLPALASAEARRGPVTGKPVPRFESLAGQEANGRRGPGLDHQVDWKFTRRGLPVVIIEESREWRRVRDPDGTTTWMHANNLSSAPTIIARPASNRPLVMKSAARTDAKPVARLAHGVIAKVKDCQGDFLQVEAGGREGWVSVREVWGAGCAAP
jgi:SH3-like domain-containing protein